MENGLRGLNIKQPQQDYGTNLIKAGFEIVRYQKLQFDRDRISNKTKVAETYKVCVLGLCFLGGGSKPISITIVASVRHRAA